MTPQPQNECPNWWCRHQGTALRAKRASVSCDTTLRRHLHVAKRITTSCERSCSPIHRNQSIVAINTVVLLSPQIVQNLSSYAKRNQKEF